MPTTKSCTKKHAAVMQTSHTNAKNVGKKFKNKDTLKKHRKTHKTHSVRIF